MTTSTSTDTINHELVKENFYNAINKEWEDNNEIPNEYSRWGTFEILHKKTQENLKELLENSDTDSKEGQLLHAFYDSYMDTEYRHSENTGPILPYLDKIKNIETSEDIINMLVTFTKDGFKTLFPVYAEPDAKDSSVIRPYMCQGGLHLPDMKYYFEEEHKEIREKYLVHMSNLFRMISYVDENELTDICKDIFTFEEKIAKTWMTREEHREIEKTYHKVNRHNHFGKNVNMLLDKLEVTDTIIYDNDNYFSYIEDLIENKKNIDIFKHYFTWNIVSGAASLLGNAFVDERFDFCGRILNGQKEKKPLWMRGLSFLEGNVGETLSKLYVDRYFPEESKTKMLTMVNNLSVALKEHIQKLDWMEDSTKVKALEKLEKFNVKIGYPNKFKDYTHLKTHKHPLNNSIEFDRYEFQTDFVNRLEKPVDKERWEMYAHTINAYFHPEMNEIVFPAAILQAPFFDPNAEDAYNYGAIGAVIGHEMTHGYDDQGRKFDSDGNLNDWWTENDTQKYNEKAERIIKQYDGYTFFDKNVSGKLTQGENIADLGGVKVAFTAMKKALEDGTYNKNENEVNVLSPEQTFFVSYATAWRNKIRKELAINYLVIDPHSPGYWRVNGVLVNVPEFFEAFDISVANKMFNDDIVSIW